MSDSYFPIIFLQPLASVLPCTAPSLAHHWRSQECSWTMEEVLGMCSQSPVLPDGKWLLSGSSCDTYSPSQYLLFCKKRKSKGGERKSRRWKRKARTERWIRRAVVFKHKAWITENGNRIKNVKLWDKGIWEVKSLIWKKKMFDDNEHLKMFLRTSWNALDCPKGRTGLKCFSWSLYVCKNGRCTWRTWCKYKWWKTTL